MKREITRLSIRIYFGDRRFGPGKADLLERIESIGSISGAARAMAMSYRRAWVLVEETNALSRLPLVETKAGGANGGGACLTANGRHVLEAYRQLIAALEENEAMKRLQSLLD